MVEFKTAFKLTKWKTEKKKTEIKEDVETGLPGRAAPQQPTKYSPT
jgi:hypothetical protein